jgi:hypothetical protein
VGVAITKSTIHQILQVLVGNVVGANVVRWL